ncbi:MAG TPA: substrate-binding domain-containing protein [Usitatibacter sp.]|nr:substrate-binding domain-containing protein [Usitatibacter sp.]
MKLRFVSAGAAQGLVRTIARVAGIEVEGQFGAVGAMLERLVAGEPCDVVILTRAQVDMLLSQHKLAGEGIADLGRVPTSIAVRSGDTPPRVDDADSLRAALLAADAIYFPNAVKSTAGIHFAKVVEKLGITPQVAPRFRTFPNGSTAMAAMAQATGNPIGCTQSTEILATPGVTLVAPLPLGFDLATTYTAAVNASAADPRAAADFVARLAAAAAQRRHAGFN